MSSRLHLTCAAALLAAAAWISTASAGEPEWIRQFGTNVSEHALGVAVSPEGRVHVVGTTDGSFADTKKGRGDIFVITFDGNGTELWRRQLGTTSGDSARGVATDADGNVYVVGDTAGALGDVNKGDYDAFVIKLDRNGTELWKRQPGTSAPDLAYAVTTDTDGNVYVAGVTYGSLGGPSKGGYGEDAFVIKYDRDGTGLWKRQPGTTSYDRAYDVATDTDGNVYVVGSTQGSLGGAFKGGGDAFVLKFDRDGRYLWKRQPGTAETDYSNGVATDADGNVYVVGETGGSLGGPNKGSLDVFVLKFDRDGRYLWKRQPGTASYDQTYGVATDTDGDVYVVGMTAFPLGGVSKGAYDAFVIKYDRDGRNVWRDQPGTAASDPANGVATDADGNAYVVGDTGGSLPGNASAGGYDAFLIKYGPNGPQ